MPLRDLVAGMTARDALTPHGSRTDSPTRFRHGRTLVRLGASETAVRTLGDIVPDWIYVQEPDVRLGGSRSSTTGPHLTADLEHTVGSKWVLLQRGDEL